MKKKLSIYISILVLLINFIPNILQCSEVFADSNNISLIKEDNLDIFYKVEERHKDYYWEINYQFKEDKKDQELKLKLQFDYNKEINITPEVGWSSIKNNIITSEFKNTDNGVIKISSPKDISKLSVKIQADSQNTTENNVIENILDGSIGKSYDLSIPNVQDSSEESDTQDSTSESDIAESDTQDSTSESDIAESDTQDSTSESDIAEFDTQGNQTTNSVYHSNFGVKTVLSSKLKNYTNIIPEYISNSDGKFPKFSWVPDNNTTVVNHQGKSAGSSQWDGLTSWDGSPENKTNSYIEYLGEQNPVDFAIRKYAKETTTPGLYDVYLNVRGNEQNPIKPIDIVLVVDMSGSMEKEKASAIRKGVKDFLSTIQDTAYSDHVNVGIVGYSSPGYLGEDKGYITVPMDKVSSTNHVDSINKALSPTFSGGTFTQLGIREGTKMLEEDTNDHQKMMIVMTDGVPTFSYKVDSASKTNNVIYGETFKSSRDEPSNTSKIGKPYDVTNINGG